jgi:methionyl-tRNA formyltransferase
LIPFRVADKRKDIGRCIGTGRDARRIGSGTMSVSHPPTVLGLSRPNEVLFLGYDRRSTPLIGILERRGFVVTQSSRPVDDLSPYIRTICFGYRHILPPAVLDTAAVSPVNLHISFLPYNRGAHPNVWSFLDDTPAGVTIHEIDEGLDTGPICMQKRVEFAPHETTFRATHARLVTEVEALFAANIDPILENTCSRHAQTGGGTYHKKADLPAQVTDWDADIAATLERIDRAGAAR